ncbi:MAG: hypothetical protein FJW31_11050 [Acidobacteria bacterium]|nr:hypothetical protein [Acidobacteriota bacterium]
MDRLAEACERVAATNSRLRKVELLSAYFRTLTAAADLERAVSFLCGYPIVRQPNARLSAGYSTLRTAALEVMPWGEETLRLCLRETGDAGEGIGHLLRHTPGEQPLPLAEADEFYVRLLLARHTQDKVRLLADAFRRYRSLAVAYLIKFASGNPRIGLQEKMVEEAVAAAHGLPVAALREASNKLGNLAQVAVAARRDELDLIEARLFHPSTSCWPSSSRPSPTWPRRPSGWWKTSTTASARNCMWTPRTRCASSRAALRTQPWRSRKLWKPQPPFPSPRCSTAKCSAGAMGVRCRSPRSNSGSHAKRYRPRCAKRYR